MATVEILKGDASYGRGWNLFLDGDYANTFATKAAAQAAAERILKEREIAWHRELAAHCARRSA